MNVRRLEPQAGRESVHRVRPSSHMLLSLWAPSQVYIGKHHDKSTQTNHICKSRAPLPHLKAQQQKVRSI